MNECLERMEMFRKNSPVTRLSIKRKKILLIGTFLRRWLCHAEQIRSTIPDFNSIHSPDLRQNALLKDFLTRFVKPGLILKLTPQQFKSL